MPLARVETLATMVRLANVWNSDVPRMARENRSV
jgi:hypothetical protein